MDMIQTFLASISWEVIIKTGLRVAVILIIAWLVMKVLLKFLSRLEVRLLRKGTAKGEPATESQKRVDTIVRLLKQGMLLALWLTMCLVILKELGIDIAPIIASAGIAGLAIGFGAQNLVRDVISGFFLILENQIRVGDVAFINGTGGLVEQINFRTVVLRDVGGVVHIFPTGTISTLSNLTNEWSAYVIDIGVAYKEDTDKVVAVMRQVGKSMLEDEKFGKLILEEPEIFGVDRFGDSAVMIKGRIKTKPVRQWDVGREYLRRLKYAFDEQGIEIPYPHRTIYFGEESKPIDLQILERFGSDSVRQQEKSSSEQGAS